MKAVQMMLQNDLSLRRSLSYAGWSRCAYYYEPRARGIDPDPAMLEKIEKLALERPSFGTRRMAAILSRDLGRSVNRKQVQRIFRILGWIEPSMKKSEIIRALANPILPTRPYELWEGDMTYLWCGVDHWCYLFNVLDVFDRIWVGYAFDTQAKSENAIMSINNSLAANKEDVDLSKLTLRVDNGSQYTSRKFIESMRALGVRVEHIFANTPEQNGHMESFHGKLKREYIWTREFRNYQEAEIAISEAFIDYNEKRPHSSLGYKTPQEFLSEWRVTHSL
jgi:putative transposase